MRPRFAPSIRCTGVFVGLLTASSTLLAQTAPAAPAAPSFGSSVLQMLFGLALVLGLLIGGLWLLKRLTTPMSGVNSLMRVVGGTAIGTRERIVIVELGQTWLVLGVTPNSINTLAEMPRQPLPPSNKPQAPNLGSLLRQFVDRGSRNAR